MDSIKVAAKTVEDALTEASIQLGTSSDNIEYTVLDEGSKGLLFGLGGRDAVIEAKKKVTDEDLMKEIFDEKPKKEEKKEAKRDFRQEKKSGKEYKREPKNEIKKDTKDRKENDREERKETKKEKTPEKETGKEEKETRETKETGTVKPEKETKIPKAPKAPADPEEAKRRAETFLGDILRAMDMPEQVTAEYEDGTLNIDIAGENMGILIGKRGQTLDALQYLTSLVVNKGKAAYVRVKLDTEDYRARRKATLENLAKNIAAKVKKTRKPVFLEPMNPYERRIIHSALQNDPYVTTHSEGEEPYRKVVVTLKKDRDKGHNPSRYENRTAGNGSERSEIEKEQTTYAKSAALYEKQEDGNPADE